MTDGPNADERDFSFVERHGFLSWLGVSVESARPERTVLTIPAADELRNMGQSDAMPIHGGVIATLIDTSTVVAMSSTFDDPTGVGLTTTNLEVSYLQPATGALTAEAEVVRAGGSMGVVDALVTSASDDGERDVAVGRTTLRLFRDS